jgi:nonsense-mediated mRNA decay protein 3
VKASKKLVGTDDKSNISNFKYTNLVEICPLCKDDLLYLPARTARNMGNIARLVLVKNISSLIHVLDPLTGQTANMNPEVYWRDPIRPIVTAARSRLTRYVVLGKEPVVLNRNVSKRTATRKMKSRIASVTIAKENDLGVNDTQVEERSHVGYLLKSGDVLLGYDLRETQLVDDDAEDARASGKMPDAVVVRKLYGGVATGEVNANQMRIWKLQRLDVDAKAEAESKRSSKKDMETDNMDEEDFMREVEADRDMRNHMNLYKTEIALKKKNADDMTMDDAVEDKKDPTPQIDDDDDEDDQEVKLDELLDGLVLDAKPDNAPPGEAVADDVPWEMQEGIEEGEKAAKDGITYVGRDQARQVNDKDAAAPVPVFGQEFMGKEFKFI